MRPQKIIKELNVIILHAKLYLENNFQKIRKKMLRMKFKLFFRLKVSLQLEWNKFINQNLIIIYLPNIATVVI